MTKIHQHLGLGDRSILDYGPEDVGLVRATICGVSSMAATEACYEDAGGHKPVTDWFLASTVPTQPCTMHRRVLMCATGNGTPGVYCPSTQVKASIVVPTEGHPLSHADLSVIRQYLPGAVIGSDSAGSIGQCNVHTEEWYESYLRQSGVIVEAQELLVSIRNAMTFSTGLSQEEWDVLTNLLTRLEEAINAQPIDETVISELMQELRQRADTYFADTPIDPDGSDIDIVEPDGNDGEQPPLTIETPEIVSPEQAPEPTPDTQPEQEEQQPEPDTQPEPEPVEPPSELEPEAIPIG